MHALLARRGLGLDFVGLRERLEQGLRLGDLRKLWRRRKACQRRTQDVVGLAGAARRLVELGERQRGAQLEAAAFLLLRDGDGGEEGGFGGSGVGGVLLQEDFAANAVEGGVEPMLSGFGRQRQRFVDRGEGRLRALPLGFEFRERPLKQRQKHPVACSGEIRQRLTKLGRAGVSIGKLRARPGEKQCSKGLIC